MAHTPEQNIEQPKRRTFLSVVIAFIGGLISLAMGVPLIGFAISPVLKKTGQRWVDLGVVDLLKGSNYKPVKYTFQFQDGWVKTTKKRSVYVTDKGNNEFVVFSRVCTHLNCFVRWNESDQQFFCPCHGGVFDKDGKVVAGPPPRPLQKLPTKVENGVLYVKES